MSCRIFLVSFTLPNYYSCLVEGYYLNNPLTLIYIHKPFRLLVLVSGQEIFPARHICMVMFMFSFIGFRFLWLWNDAAVVSSGNILLCSLSVSSLLGSCNIGGLIVLWLTFYVGFSLLKHPWYIEDDEMVIWELKECWGSFSEMKTFIAIAKIAVCITTC